MPTIVPRVVQPELMDALPPDDVRVRRCRRDLRRINWFMGNHRWIERTLIRHAECLGGGIVELGAGDGALLERLASRHPDWRLAGWDLAPRPASLTSAVGWRSGDFLAVATRLPGSALVANLVLHHFQAPQLAELGRRMQSCDLIVIGESHRDEAVLRRARWFRPILGELTRNDMEISLRAGFCSGELPPLLGLEGPGWRVEETTTLLGAYRLVAMRCAPGIPG